MSLFIMNLSLNEVDMIHDSFTGISAAGVKHYDINSGSTYAQIVDAVAELVKG